jgi:hypothetical protein
MAALPIMPDGSRGPGAAGDPRRAVDGAATHRAPCAAGRFSGKVLVDTAMHVDTMRTFVKP